MEQILKKRFEPKRIIVNPTEGSLRNWALEHGGIISEFGNLSVTTKVRNRMAKLTEVILDQPDQEDTDSVLLRAGRGRASLWRVVRSRMHRGHHGAASLEV